MDLPVSQNAKVLLERCESGRIGVTANDLTWVTGSEGSNPSLSARRSGTLCPTIRMVGPRRRACRVLSPRRDPAWCEECVTSWASTGCRPWGARRTRSTPTSWRVTSWPRGMAAPTMRTRPTWWWSTPAPSSSRPGRSPSTPCWNWRIFGDRVGTTSARVRGASEREPSRYWAAGTSQALRSQYWPESSRSRMW